VENTPKNRLSCHGNEIVDKSIDRIAELSEEKVQQGQRDQHPKQHGCVWAEFTVLEHLPKQLKVGVFASPKTFSAWIRFSSGQAQDDSEGDLVYGVAIKLMNVAGKKILEDEEHAKTQDFVLSTLPAFFVKDAEDYVQLLEKRKATNNEAKAFAQFLIPGWNPLQWRWREAQVLLSARFKQVFRKPASPLDINYWSTTPYRLGTQAIKFFIKPTIANRLGQSPNQDPNYLRKAMVDHLTYQSAEFDFYVQLQNQNHPDQTPVDDPRIVWKNAETYRVARIRIPAQTFDSPKQREFGENLSFTPWHCLPEHQPLGSINQARKDTYQRTSKLRHKQRAISPQEPTPATFEPQLRKTVMLSDRPVQQHPLTFIAKIQTKRKADLETILEKRIKINPTDDNEKDNEIRSRFRESRLTHFARFVILEDNDAMQGLEPHLYFSSNYDGTFEDYVQELVALMGDKLGEIFECCEGYTVGWSLNADRLAEFLRSHSFQPENVFYNAYRLPRSTYGLSVEAIRKYAEVFNILKQLLENLDNCSSKLNPQDSYKIVPPAESLAPNLWSNMLTRISKFIEPCFYELLAIGSRLLQFFLGLTPKKSPHPAKIAKLKKDFAGSKFENNLKFLADLEDKITQNQITVLTPLKTWDLFGIRVDWFYRMVLSFVLFILNWNAPKDLPKLGTIHLARWVIVDLEAKVNDRRRKTSYLLFESNYDEAWDGYIDSFVKNTGDGMNVIWGPCVGFPTTGADDIEWFKYYIRQHQFPAQMFYSAHPDLSIGRIHRNRQISQWAMQLLEFLR
jgi:hypothetical protein